MLENFDEAIIKPLGEQIVDIERLVRPVNSFHEGS